jgi:hypothetical protein
MQITTSFVQETWDNPTLFPKVNMNHQQISIIKQIQVGLDPESVGQLETLNRMLSRQMQHLVQV